jgi:hypothetical protein
MTVSHVARDIKQHAIPSMELQTITFKQTVMGKRLWAKVRYQCGDKILGNTLLAVVVFAIVMCLLASLV